MAYVTTYMGEDALPDLRPICADILETAATVPGHLEEGMQARGVKWHGAQLLRWSAEREAPKVEDLQAEIERLLDLLKEIEHVISDVSKDDTVRTVRGQLADIRVLVGSV